MASKKAQISLRFTEQARYLIIDGSARDGIYSSVREVMWRCGSCEAVVNEADVAEHFRRHLSKGDV
jgi:hypothetical protein